MSRRWTPSSPRQSQKGQSVAAVMSANEGMFGGYGRSTVYGWLRAGLFRAKGHDLPFAGRSRRPHKKPETRTKARFRIGRTIREMWEWLKLHVGIVPCELDTVAGSISGKVVCTMIFPKSGLALGFLRDQKTSQTTATRAGGSLTRSASSGFPQGR